MHLDIGAIAPPASLARAQCSADDRESASKAGIAVLALDAGILTMIGSSIRGDLQLLAGVPVTVVACIVGWASIRDNRHRPLSSVYALLAVAVGVGFVVPSPGGARWYEIPYRLHPLVGLFAIAVAAAGTPRQRNAAVAVASASAVLVCAIAPLGVPTPRIDVWEWIQTTGRALATGVHPYTVSAPDAYHGAFDFGSTPPRFPYMPAIVLLSAPATVLLGDYRYGLALSLIATLWFVKAAAAKLDADPALTAAAMLALVLHPRLVLLVSLGFPEFLMIAATAAFLYFAARRQAAAEAIAFFILPVLKQYVAAPVLLYCALRRRWKVLLFGAVAAGATFVPFVVWNRSATLEGTLYLVRAPVAFRLDSTAVTALVARLTGAVAPRWLAIAGQFVAAAVAWLMLRDRGPGGVLLGSALSLVVCFLLATQAFMNYYLFAAALFVLAAVALSARRPVAWE